MNDKLEEFKMADDRLQKLNEFIQANFRSLRDDTNYDMLHYISMMMAKGLKVENRSFHIITKSSTMDQTMKIALQFFKELDQDLYDKVEKIVEGNSDIGFKMYMIDGIEDFSKTTNDGMPVYTEAPRVITHNGKTVVYIPCKGTIEDIYLLVHELSHTFDLTKYEFPTRNLLGEITPHCFEAMLGQYLLKNGIASKKDIIDREKGEIVGYYDDGVETFAKLELIKIQKEQGIVKQEDIDELQKKYSITNKQLEYIITRLECSGANVDYKARYMTAQLIYPYYMEQYQQDSQNAIRMLKEYFEQIKANNFGGSLSTLGINPALESVPKLIEAVNRRIGWLEQQLNSISTEDIRSVTGEAAISDIEASERILSRDERTKSNVRS